MANNAGPLDSLIGEEVSAVSFVTDYVELHFNGPVLRCIANPVLERGTWKVAFPSPGSRDALCALIATRVQQVMITEGVAIEIRFDSGDTLQVPLTEESQRGGEWVHFVSGEDQPVQVW